MPEAEDEAQYHEARFLALISGLSSGAMQHLGKVINPLTGKIERDLQSAKGTIDLLRMLREKTRGNLTDREKRALDALLSSLQLNYLDELKAEAAKPKEEAAQEVVSEPAKEEKAKETAPPQPEEGEASEEKVTAASPETEAKGGKSPSGEPPAPEKETGKRKKKKRARANE
jgi:hypothetical protein